MNNYPDDLKTGMQIDKEFIEAQFCPECGKKMKYRSVIEKIDDRYNYKAFAVCENCGEEFEF